MDKIVAGVEVERNFALVCDLCEGMTDGSLRAMGRLKPVPALPVITHCPEECRPAILPTTAE